MPSAVALAITQSGCEWIFRIGATDVVYTKRIVDFAVNELKVKKIAIIHDNNDFGQAGAAMLIENLKATGLKPVGVEGFTAGTKDFSPSLLKAKAAGADAIILWANYIEGAQLIRQIRQLNIPGEVLVNTGVTIGNFFELADDAADNFYGVQGGFIPERLDAMAQDFIKEFNDKVGYIPDTNVALGYDAVNVLAKAINDAGKIDRTAVRDALRKI